MPKQAQRSRLLVTWLLVLLLGQADAADAQSASDSLFLLPAPSLPLSCETVRGSPINGVYAFRFDVGTSEILLRSPDGQVTPLGPPARQLVALFDSTGRPMTVADMTSPSSWRTLSALVTFDSTGRASGYREEMLVDSAALMTTALRDGVDAGLAAIRQAAQAGQRTPLDSASLERARGLATHLWGKRCS